MDHENVLQSAAECIRFGPKVINQDALLMLAIGRFVLNKMGVPQRQNLCAMMTDIIENQVRRDNSPFYMPFKELDPSERGRNHQMAAFIIALTGSEPFVRRK